MTRSRRTAPGRARPSAPPGTRVYAIGDCHGCTAHLRALHAAILDDCRAVRKAGPEAGSEGRRLVAVYVGDYIDRGPDSRGLLDILIDEPLPGFERVHLLGNHDAMLLRLIDGLPARWNWMLNGAAETLASYGVDPAVWSDGPAALRAALMARLPASHAAFLRSLRLSHVEGDYFFAHAGIRPGVPLDAQEAEDLLWIRELFLESAADHGKIIVHGHTPADAPEVRDNRIGIDTGAVYGGVLTALVLDRTERRFLHAG